MHHLPWPPTCPPSPPPAHPRQVCTTDPEAAHSHKLDSFEVPYDILILGVSELWERRGLHLCRALLPSSPPLPAQAPFLAGQLRRPSSQGGNGPPFPSSQAHQCYAALPPATCVRSRRLATSELIMWCALPLLPAAQVGSVNNTFGIQGVEQQ